MGKYHKVTAEEHVRILASRNSVCRVPYAKIAEKLEIPERTVRRYATKQPGGVKFQRNRVSVFDPYKAEIEALLNKDMGKQSYNIKNAMIEFRKAHPDLEFQKTAFYDFVHNKCDLTREPKLARIPLEHEYGDAQIDFCDVKYYRNGKFMRGNLFTMTFVKSGVSFVQVFPAENQQCLFEGMRNIFEYTGFVPKSILFDNASTAVLATRKEGQEAIPTKEYEKFAAWYGFKYKFCNPASGWEKGAVEHANDTKRHKYFTGHPEIGDEREFNRTLLDRCFEDARERHYLKGIPKIELFKDERAAGLPLPSKPFDCGCFEIRKTDKCAMIQLQTCRYSVSDKHPRKKVVVKYTAFGVEIYETTGKLICKHRRSYKPGSTTIDPTMYKDALAARPRARIRKSDNEFTGEILTELEKAVASVRPAAREAAVIQLCEQKSITCRPLLTHSKQSMLLFELNPIDMDKEHYDQNIRSNGLMVQAAEIGGAVHRGRTKQKDKGEGLSR